MGMEVPDKMCGGEVDWLGYGDFVADLNGEHQSTMEDVFTHIMQAHDQNQHHVTKGYGLADLDDLGILKHAGGELLELGDACATSTNYKLHIQEELGDTMSCLIHLAVKHGIKADELAKTIIEKMSKRFA